MASTHTSNLNLEKPALGDQSGEWGTTVNSNMELIDAAVNAKIPKTDLLDEDNMASNSATKPASQQSIKAYVDGASVNQEQVEDIVGGMLDGDETFITVTYDDTDGNIDFTVPVKDEDDMASNSATHLSTQQSIKAYVDAQIATEDTIAELNDTAVSSPAAGHLLIYHNTNSNWANSTLTAGSNISVTNADGAITIAATDTNTQLTEEQVEDFVGGMVTGNTETGIAVTYQDGDGTLDFVVADTTVSGDSGSTGITPGDTLVIAGGTNVTTAMSGDTLTITSTDTNTQLSQEQVEDFVGGMLDGTETFISVSYDDTDGNLDFVVPVLDEDDFSSNSAAHLATQQSIKAYVAANSGGSPAADDIAIGDAAVSIATTVGNITIDAQANDADVIIKVDDAGVAVTAVTFDGSEGGNALFANDIKLVSDASVLGFGVDNDVTLTHVHDTGLLLNAAMQLQFRDGTEYIHSSTDGQLDIDAATEVQIDTGTLDINATTTVDIDTNADSSMMTLNNAHGSEAEIGLLLTKASGAGYGAKFQAGTDVWLAGDNYSFYANGGELRNNNETGQTYICRFYNSDSTAKLNFYVKDNGTFNTGTDGSSPYNFTTSLSANCNLVGTGIMRRTTSSLRFKSNVEPIDPAWADKLLELQPINYKSTAPADGDVDSSWTFYGFGAEDVAKIDPRYVFWNTHKNVHDEATGEDTSVLLDDAIPDGVAYDRMVPALIDIIKRLEKRVAVLEEGN